jgi:uncharacterized protein (DUF2235 family)
MGLEWLGRKGDQIAAFLVTSQMMLVIGSLLVTYLVMRLVLATLHRPWQSPYWTLYPLGVAITVVAVILLVWPGQPRWALGLSCLVSLAGIAWLTFQVSERVRRAKQIVVAGAKRPAFECKPGSLGDAPAAAGSGRRIVIFCDGTSNKPDQLSDGEAAPTNVYRLYRDLQKDESQTAWYDPGVGTETSSQAVKGATAGRIAAMIGWLQGSQGAGLYVKFRTIVEAGFGVGITENIVQAYTEIVRQYRPGDRIYLIGFSRGAYTARCVAGVIRRCGLLTAENIRYCPDIVRLYRTRKESTWNVPIRPELIHKQLPAIEFLGLFDAVGSLGVPMWGWWFNWRLFFRNTPLSTDPSPICAHVYHALAMDERRSQFFPTPFDETRPDETWNKTLEQLWFRGAHCDVGGGYADRGLSDVTLEWMLNACIAHGLVFKGKLFAELRPDPLARMHDELQRQPAWRLMGSWPRWHPVDRLLHPSVMARANAIHALGRHDMRKVGSSPQRFIVGAQREWDRTGLILEGDGTRYLLKWKEGKWRDKDCPPCDPAGQPGRDFFRWLFRFRRRLPQRNYMMLCISIAHPRQWPLREGGLARLLRYVFWRDPVEMREQVAPIGCDFDKHDSVIVQNNGTAGILYAFANDAWMTAANNSGGLEMTIERLDEDSDPTVPVWTLSCTMRHRKRPTDWLSTDTEAWQWTHSRPA